MVRSSLKQGTVLALFFLTCISMRGQDDLKKNIFRMNAGAGYIARQDIIFSPLVHKDLTYLSSSFEFTRHAGFYQSTRIQFAAFDPAVSKDINHNFILFKITYSLGKTWSREKDDFTLAMMLQADIQALDYVYGRISGFGYYTAAGPGILAEYGLRTGKDGRISATLRIPAVSLYARSPYLVNDDEFIENISSHSGLKTFRAFLRDGEWVTLNKLQQLDAGIEYDHQVSSRWGLGAGWMFEFIHTPLPRKLLSFHNSLYLSFYF